MSVPSIWIALACALLSSYFAASNIALKTLNRNRLTELLEDSGKSDRLAGLLSRLSQLQLITAVFRSCLGLGVLLAMLYYFESRFPAWPLATTYLTAFIAAGVLVCVFTVGIAISWARYQRERLIVWSLPLFAFVVFVFRPVVAALSVFDPIVRRLSGVDLHPTDLEEQLTDELLSAVDEHQQQGDVRQEQKEMLEAVVEFPTIAVDEIMTPRTDVEGFEVDASLDQIKEKILSAGHSRYPVYEESLDHIVGILNAKDLIRYVGDHESFELRSVLRDAMMVPESKSVRELMAEFKAKKVHIAIVLDEFGGTAGLVTLEDIVEEIVGEIHDEYEPADEQEPTISRVDDQKTQVDARVYIHDLNDELGVKLPEDEDYDTVGGFVCSRLGRIPGVGEHFEFDNLAFTITDAERTHVKRVLLEQLVGPNGGKNGGKNGGSGRNGGNGHTNGV